MKYSIIIPCFNEEANVGSLIDMLSKTGTEYDIEWIMVENGSGDNTRKKLEEVCGNKSNFKIVYVDKNQGYGYGLLNGLKEATGDYIGWLHADMQVSPDYMLEFINDAEKGKNTSNVFYKGKRQNRSLLECFFTGSMTVFATLLFGTYLFDIGAIPVLFSKALVEELVDLPYDFSIETYVYWVAKKNGYKIVRRDVDMKNRVGGKSSWNHGLKSKIKQSKRIMQDLIKIKQGRSVR